MITKLRRRHRMVMPLLFLAVTVVFVWGLVARREIPEVASPPEGVPAQNRDGVLP